MLCCYKKSKIKNKLILPCMPRISSQTWFRLWLGAVRHQAITWASVDQVICQHVESLEGKELILWESTLARGFQILTLMFQNNLLFWKLCCQIFSCDQAALWMVQSVCLSVRLSVRPSVTPFWLCSHHRIIMKFSGVITNDRSDVHAKGQGLRSKVKVTEVNTQLSRFWRVTPVWIHIWWWNDAQSLMLLGRGALSFFKVIRQISRSHSSKNRRVWPKLGVSGL